MSARADSKIRALIRRLDSLPTPAGHDSCAAVLSPYLPSYFCELMRPLSLCAGLRRRLVLVLVASGLLGLLARPVKAAGLQRDVVYGEATGEKLLLDVHVPEGPGPFPIAILVHGGGWSQGDKAGSDRLGNSADITPWFGPLSAANFTWFSINYRLAPRHRWPACSEDVETAIRWVKKHAAEYKGDAKRIALFGHSAGGQLVCYAATTAKPDAQVQAVVGFAPVTDFEQELPWRGGLSSSLQKLHGLPAAITPSSLQLLRETSPINHVRPGLPPFLILHGDADKTVPYQQSLNFQARLRAAGDRCDLITIPGAPHGLLTWSQYSPHYSEDMIKWVEAALAGQLSTATGTPQNDPR
jgi:alpha-L-fucosidase 2